LLLFFLIFPKKVYAYLDPGSGSFIFQLFMGFLLGGLVAIRIYWKKIKNFCQKFFSKGRDEKKDVD
jgi:hypothetical protein